jgi:gamma-glutamylputrescine oxidase
MFDRYPRSPDGQIIANSVEVPEAARPHFDVGPLSNSRNNGHATIVVLGAGYTGLSAALKLAELGLTDGVSVRIILLDARRIGDGPSGKSAGHICGLQARRDDMERHCGPILARRLIEAADLAADIVKRRINQFRIPCNLRDGYIHIRSDDAQTLETGGSRFGVDSYPYVLGLAFACSELGVDIYEKTEVTAILDKSHSCEVIMADGAVIQAACVVAAGAHHMAARIGLLRPLRARTTELKVSTIITDPIPDSVHRAVMPLAEGRYFPFANESANVVYGAFDGRRRMVFGADATALRDPDLKAIARRMHATFPKLADAYQAEMGHPLAWRPFVTAEPLCYTRDALPNVGTVGPSRRVFYVHALGGHGLAVGTMLGEAVARKIWSAILGHSSKSTMFDDFASVRHGWLPPWQPARRLTASIGLLSKAP